MPGSIYGGQVTVDTAQQHPEISEILFKQAAEEAAKRFQDYKKMAE